MMLYVQKSEKQWSQKTTWEHKMQLIKLRDLSLKKSEMSSNAYKRERSNKRRPAPDPAPSLPHEAHMPHVAKQIKQTQLCSAQPVWNQNIRRQK